MRKALFWLLVVIVFAPFVIGAGFLAYCAWQVFHWWAVAAAVWVTAATVLPPDGRGPG